MSNKLALRLRKSNYESNEEILVKKVGLKRNGLKKS